nr:nucleocapsid protein [Megaderma bat coronavirus]URD31325.1 nucleocapsid protein [Megaderma bat coronavirus]
MASVSFQEQNRGRTGKVPLSLYHPVMVTDDTPFWRAMPNNAVPTGTGTRDQQIGYWNEQQRWRMIRGQRKTLPSKWHFYYLGTGPQADAKFRQRVNGVYWVAVQGSKTESTGLPTRKRNADLKVPQFAVQLPSNIQILEDSGSRAASRSQSNNRERSQSNNRSSSRGPNQGQNQNQTPKQQRSRNQSQNRGQSQKQDPVDIVAAVKQALQELGVTPKNQQGNNGKQKKKSTSGSNTPRAKSPARSPQSQRKQLERPVWKRVPTSDEDVTACFGPRDAARNFGDAALVRNGVDAKHYPQIAELVPSTAALLFGGEVTTREVGDEVEITYHYKMKVRKDDKNLPAFLQQVSAYATPSQAQSIPSQLNPQASTFQPAQSEVEVVEMINEVFDS